MTLYVAPIVEGHTEQNCVERLLHRIWLGLLGSAERLQVLAPLRPKRDAIVHHSGETFGVMVQNVFTVLSSTIRKDISGRGLILVLLDAERDCPMELAPRLLESARKARSDADLACVIATRMFENWIVAGASTSAGVNDLPDPLPARDQFEERSGVAWLDKQMRSRDRARSYRKGLDAKVFVQSMNLTECRANSLSFDKLCRELEKRLPAKSAAESTKE